MKTKSQAPTTDHGQAMAKYDKLPEETKRALELKQQAEKAAGAKIQKKIRKHSRAK